MSYGIDAEIQQRYSEAQIPDLVANAIPQVLEAEMSRQALSPTGGFFASGATKCAFRSTAASKSRELVFASSSADKGGSKAGGTLNYHRDGTIGGL